MKVSVCISVLSEEKSVGKLLESLLNQSKKPNEIIIVDGGSKDKTVEIIKHFQKKDKRIKLVKQRGNVAKGRNTSIEVAKNEIIAITDAGCVRAASRGRKRQSGDGGRISSHPTTEMAGRGGRTGCRQNHAAEPPDLDLRASGLTRLSRSTGAGLVAALPAQ